MPKIKGYKLIEEVGVGGVGKVYLALQESMNREVAIKILSPKFTSSKKFVEEFVTEARRAGKLNHPNIVSVYDVGNTDKLYYYTMVFVQGKTLKEIIKEKGAISQKDALKWMLEMALALKEAHANNIVHRDVKPANIIMDDRTKRSMLADLGIATLLPKKKTTSSTGGPIVGTPQYMPPEQAMGKAVDGRADQYALGATFYHALTGRMPVTGSTIKEILDNAINTKIIEPIKIRSSISDEVNEMLMRMLSKKPANRYPSDDALIKVINDLISSGAGKSRKQGKASTTAVSRPVRVPRTNVTRASRAARRRTSSAGSMGVVGMVVLVVAALVVGNIFYKRVVVPDQQAAAEKGRKAPFATSFRKARGLYLQQNYQGALDAAQKVHAVTDEEKLALLDFKKEVSDKLYEFVERDVKLYRTFARENPDNVQGQIDIIDQLLARYPDVDQIEPLQIKRERLLKKLGPTTGQTQTTPVNP